MPIVPIYSTWLYAQHNTTSSHYHWDIHILHFRVPQWHLVHLSKAWPLLFPSSVNAFTVYNCILFWALVPSFHSHFMSLCCMVHVHLVLDPDPQRRPAMWVWVRAWVLAKRADSSSQVFVRFPIQSLHTGQVKTVLAICCPPRLTLGYTSLTVHEVVHEVHR